MNKSDLIKGTPRHGKLEKILTISDKVKPYLNEGDIRKDTIHMFPKVGKPCIVGTLCTSVVKEIIEEGYGFIRFVTHYSIYDLHYIPDNDIECVFRLYHERELPKELLPTESKNIDNFVPDGWSKKPLELTDDLPCLFKVERGRFESNWGQWSEPIFWSMRYNIKI